MRAISDSSPNLLVYLLTTLAVGVLVLIYISPIWWVSLTAPNYPEEAFPDGVRIHFHFNGVFNGCSKIDNVEIQEDEALDCVHEMDTINHYVGMYPIAAGGVIERAFSPFLVSMMAVMLIGFSITSARWRVVSMGVGFVAVAAWMILYFYGAGGVKYQNEGYLEALSTSMDQEAGSDDAMAMSPGQALIELLKAEMAAVVPQQDESNESDASDESSLKQRYINNLSITFKRDMERRGLDQQWTGSGAQVLAWHYEKSLGRYFNNPDEIEPLVRGMSGFAHLVLWGVVAAMLLMVWGGRRNGGGLYWLLIVVPLALPIFFIIEYSAWLWWYGHSLNAMGAFTVKPFMPTVFGDGKVAQFSTHSYPYVGFFLMLAYSLLLTLAAVVRRRQWSA